MMTTKRVLACWAAVFALCALLPMAAWATTTHYLEVRASTCAGQDKTTTPYAPTFGSSGSIRSAPTNEVVLHCDVKIPDNATMIYVRGYGYDSNANTITVALKKNSFYYESTTTIGTATSSNGTTSWASASFSEAIDNDNYAYFIEVSIPGNSGGEDLRIWTLEVQYTTP